MCVCVCVCVCGVILNANLEPKTHHQTPMTWTYGYSHVIYFKTVATEVEIQCLSALFMFPSLLLQFESAFFSSKEGCSSIFVHIMNVQVIGVWWWSFGSRSVFKVTPEVFSCLSADQTSSSTLTESSFIFDPCLIHTHTHTHIYVCV